MEPPRLNRTNWEGVGLDELQGYLDAYYIVHPQAAKLIADLDKRVRDKACPWQADHGSREGNERHLLSGRGKAEIERCLERRWCQVDGEEA